MSFAAGLCLVFMLSSTLANPVPTSNVDQLLDEISSKVAGEMAQVAKNSKDTDPLELNIKLLNTTNKALKEMNPQIQELLKSITASSDVVEKLVNKIKQDKVLRNSLPGGGNQPRAAQDILDFGINQVVLDELQETQLRALHVPILIGAKSILRILPAVVGTGKAVYDQVQKN